MRKGKNDMVVFFVLFCRMSEEVIKAHAWWIKKKKSDLV